MAAREARSMKRPPSLATVLFVVFGALGLLAALVWRGSERPKLPLFVSAEWLSAHLDDPDLVLLHVGKRELYPAHHLPGARYVTLDDLSLSNHDGQGLILEMPPPKELQGRLEALGISHNSKVVVYYGEDWVSPATRVVFTLDYAGLGGQAALLDGGMGAWAKAGKPTTDVAPPPPKKGTLGEISVRPIIVDAAAVRASVGKPGIAVVDARNAPYYSGAESGESHGRAHRAGHVAGALNLPFSELTDDSLVWRSADRLRELFDRAGVKPGDTVIAYCHIGQQATALLLAARALGHPVRLYDGSFEDWSLFHPDYPVEASREVKQ